MQQKDIVKSCWIQLQKKKNLVKKMMNMNEDRTYLGE